MLKAGSIERWEQYKAIENEDQMDMLKTMVEVYDRPNSRVRFAVCKTDGG